jgi:hypothetical protein
VSTSISPIGGFVLGLVAGLIIVFDAVLAFLVGDVLTGIIGIVFFILILVFAIMGYTVKQQQTRLISSFALMLIGFIIMILAPVLISGSEFVIIVIAILGGLLSVLATVLMFPRKPKT